MAALAEHENKGHSFFSSVNGTDNYRMMHQQEPARVQRIPLPLQSVFVRSNRGVSVSKAPPERMASRTFLQNIFFRRPTSFVERRTKVYISSKDKVVTTGARKTAKLQSETTSESTTAMASSATTNHDKETVEYTLQEYFDALLKERGYVVKLYSTLDTGYYNEPTPLQIASYGPRMITIVRGHNIVALRETMAIGLSPNPCNRFGESLLHMVCRRGDSALLQVMIEAGTSLQIADDYGRTPLHDAFWAANPAYEVVETILKRDAGLFFMKDKRGSLPLSYAHKDHWVDWMKWFDGNIDRFFPEQNAKFYHPVDLVLMKPNSFSLPEPKTDMSLELIQMVACGDLSPQEARIMSDAARDGDASTVTGTDDEVSSHYGGYDDSDYDSDDDDDDLDAIEGDLVEMLQFTRGDNR